MKNIAVFFGGISPEHDISCITGIQTVSALDERKYNIYPVYVDKDGKMYNKAFFDIKSVASYTKKRCDKIKIVSGGIKKNIRYIPIDCAILCFHGGSYEGGGFSSTIEEKGIAYTSSRQIPSGISMDKDMQKLVAISLNIPVLPYIAKNFGESIEEKIDQPVVVKPNSLGSSIGVTVCKDEKELRSAEDIAFSFDDKILIEKKAENFYELNISAINDNGEVLVSAIERPITQNEILSFSEKYLKNGKTSSGMKSLKRECPAKVDEKIKEKVQEYAKTLYKRLSLFGIVRFDFIVENEEVYFNEVNVIPGSLSWYLWQEKGMSFSDLLDMAIKNGIKRYEKDKEKIRIIDTEVLK